MSLSPARADASTRSAFLPQRLDFLEGLRGLAALWVVLSHLWIFQFGLAAHPGRLGLAGNWLLYSHLAVDVFIVLSGFCLILPVLRDGELAGGARAFLARRARRILPPFYVALALAVLVALILGRIDRGAWSLSWPALAVNLLLLQDVFLRWNIFNGPLWSVAVECRIYLLFPLLVAILQRRGRRAVLMAAGVAGGGLTAAVLLWRPDLLLACPWYLLLFAMGLCAGSLVFGPAAPAEGRRVPAVTWAALGLLALLLHLFPVTAQGGDLFGRHMPEIDCTAGLLAAGLLILVGRDWSGQRRAWGLSVLSWAPLVWLGRISYSLYLTHAPLLLVLNRLLNCCPAFVALSPLARVAVTAALGLPLLLGAARLFFRLVEQPCLTRRRRTADPRALSPQASAAGLLQKPVEATKA